MHIIKMIVGLSNPKLQYHNTRHNVGSWFVYYLAKCYLTNFKEEKKFFGFTSLININTNRIRLLIPNIFMNLNGKSIFNMADFYNIHLNQILIVHDDLDLQPGFAKLKYGYGHNGHNGLRNIISTFNKKIYFYRVRIGIGRPSNKDIISSFVLSNPNEIEKTLIRKSIVDAVEETIHAFFKD